MQNKMQNLHLKLWNRFKGVEIEETKLSNIFDLETTLTPILIEMREHGIRVILVKLMDLKKNL